MSDDATTALSLFDARGILTDLMETRDDTKCDICGDPFGTESFTLCQAPEVREGDPVPEKKHSAHSACAMCASDPCNYIAEGGACRPCLIALGGRRSHVKMAGVAIRNPARNALADRLLEGFDRAQSCIDEARDREDRERIQEGAARRTAAVEEKRRRKAEQAAELAREAEEHRMRLEAEEADRRLALEAEEAARRRELEAEAERARAALEAEEAHRRQELEKVAERHRRRMEKEATEQRKRLSQETYEHRMALETEEEETRRKCADMAEAAAAEAREAEAREARAPAHVDSGSPRSPASQAAASPARKRKAQDPDKVRARIEKAKRTRAERKRKLDGYDALLEERDALRTECERLAEKLEEARDVALTYAKASDPEVQFLEWDDDASEDGDGAATEGGGDNVMEVDGDEEEEEEGEEEDKEQDEVLSADDSADDLDEPNALVQTVPSRA